MDMARFHLAVQLLTVTTIIAATNSYGQVTLPLNLPSYCGGTVQVQAGDTCTSLASFAGLSLSKWQSLNPSIDCSGPVTPDSQVCIGDKLSFCNNLYYSNGGDTCQSIAANIGRIISSQGGTECQDPIPQNTPLCIADTPNACDIPQIGGVSISSDLQNLLGGFPDFCTLVQASGAQLTPYTLGGISSLQLTLTSVTPAVQQVLSNAGHPELNAFQTQLAAKNVQSLLYTFVPGYLPGNRNLATFSFERPGGSTRKLLKKYYWGGTKIGVNYSYLKYLPHLG